MLTIRKRGRVYHVRGSVRLGGETRRIKEHSTGCDRRDDAEAYRARLEHDVRQAMLHGARGKAQGLTIADAGLLYMNRPGGLKSYDLWRLDQLNDVVGDYLVPNAPEAWGRFKQVRCGGLAPATVERFRSVLQAALNYAAAVERFDAPKLGRTGRVPKKRIRFLSRDQETRLLASYAPHVRPIAEALCFQGLRVGEALRLDWAHVDWAGNSLFIAETKTGDARSVTLHPRVRKALHGRPYADPRRYKLPGGSPIRRAHQTACARAGADDFHVHDWRHHWACRCVMSGIDLETIRQEGGWKSLRMVEHYATVSAAHRAIAMKKLR
jgi:integrase